MPSVTIESKTLDRLYQVTNALTGFSFRCMDERMLHDGIASVFNDAGIDCMREVVAGADRYDFLIDDRIVLEVKIDGSLSEALRQCNRYLANDTIKAAVLATTRMWGVTARPYTELHGKPLFMVKLIRSSF